MLSAVLSGIALALLAPWLGRRTGRAVGWIAAGVPAALFVYFTLLASDVVGGTAHASRVTWVPSLGIELSFYLDGLALLFALLITGIGALIFVYTGAYMDGDPRRSTLVAYLAFFMSAMLGTVLADNVLTLFVFWELTSISSYLLIGFDYERPAARSAALQALLVTGLGGLAMLAGLLLLAQAGGTYELSELSGQSTRILADPRYEACLLLILLGAFTKSAQWPFSFWLPGAMEAPSPVSAYLHSSTMVKAGVYLVARLAPVLGGTAIWTGSVVTVGLVTMVVAALLAARQTDLKRILAYSTVSALGTIMWLLGSGSHAAAVAAMGFLLGHAFYKATLFLTAGTVTHESGERDIRRLGGLRRAMPMTAAAAMLAGLSMAGVPPFLGFIGKELVFEAALHGAAYIGLMVGLSILAMVLFVAIGLLTGFGPYIGACAETPAHAHEGPLGLWLGPVVLAACGLVAGVVPRTAAWIVGPAASSVMGVPSSELDAVRLALWHGPTPTLGLSALALAGGIALFWRSGGRTCLLPSAIPEALSGGGLYTTTFDGLNRLAAGQTRVLQSGYLRFYLAIIVASTVGLVTYTLWRRPWPALAAPVTPFNWLEVALVALILVAAVAAVMSRKRLGAVAMLGVVGYGVALLFAVNGAPDLAMTQFIIEALTVVLFVFVVYRLPRITVESTVTTRARDIAIAVSAGGLISTLVWVAMQLQLSPSISDFFTERSLIEAHGRNVVNVILVDFRALDTLGEIAVLALAGVGVHALVRLHLVDHSARSRSDVRTEPAPDRPMTSVILRTTTLALEPLLLLYSVYLLLSGHNAPGGGFSGGLVASAVFALHLLAYDALSTRRMLLVRPETLIGTGLLLAMTAGMWGALRSRPFLTGLWTELHLNVGEVAVGTPLLFDVGVYVVVVGVSMIILLSLAEE